MKEKAYIRGLAMLLASWMLIATVACIGNGSTEDTTAPDAPFTEAHTEEITQSTTVAPSDVPKDVAAPLLKCGYLEAVKKGKNTDSEEE